MIPILQPYKDVPKGANYVASTPDHVLWGRLPSRNDTCIASIDEHTGDIIIDTVSHEGLLPDQGSDPVRYFGAHGIARDQILDDAVAIAREVRRDPELDGPHVVTGPIYVPHAHPGDLLAITIKRLEKRVPYGVISTRHGRGVLADFQDFDGNYGQFCTAVGDVATFPLVAKHDALTVEGDDTGLCTAHDAIETPTRSNEEDADSVEFPLHPFLGIIGVTPDSEERPNSIPPAAYGGNIDLKELTEGSTLFIPVQVEGAGFYIGDSHFAQGNGEVSLTALEASLRAHIHVEVIAKAQRSQLCGDVDTPFAYVPSATTYGTLIPTGMDVDIDVALQRCVRNAISVIANLFGVPERQAYLLLSAAVDFDVTQAVDSVKGVHALINISMFEHCSKFAEAVELLRAYDDVSASANDTTASAELITALNRYESALMSNDLDTMAELFADDPRGIPVTRADASGVLIGHEAITAFRSGRGGAPQRVLLHRNIRPLGVDAACVVSEFETRSGGRVIQSQVWQRLYGNWQIVDAHLTYPVSAIDQRIWRVVGAPLVQSPHHAAELSYQTVQSANHAVQLAPLAGMSVAVKDLFAVRGYAIGAGNPEYVRTAPVQQHHATAVQQLLDAGADIAGIAQTDEFAYSLAGTNIHYGTPPNPKALGRISGGSSSGVAAAVATGQVDIGLGTDTAGSIRVPAAYQGLWGIRTTHNRVSQTGVYPLSESFDTVGCMTRDAHTLSLAAAALMPDDDEFTLGQDRAAGVDVALCTALDECAQPDVKRAFTTWRSCVTALSGNRLSDDALSDRTLSDGATDSPDSFHISTSEFVCTPRLLDQWLSIFSTVRGYEAWQVNGEWVAQHSGALAPEIAARFERDSHITADEYQRAYDQLLQARAWIREILGSRVLIIPSTSSVAPLAHPDAAGLDAIEQARAHTLRLTCIAGVAGLPAVTIPYHTAEQLPCGICLIGPAGSDKSLITFASQLHQNVAYQLQERDMECKNCDTKYKNCYRSV